MKITIVTPLFPPEIGGAVHLVYELAKSLNSFGHKVLILTGYPRYNMHQIPKEYLQGIIKRERIDGIDVRRLRIPHFPGRRKTGKGIQHILYSIWLCGLFLLSARSDVTLTYSPPLPLPWLLSWVGKLKKVPLVVSIQDLFPLEAVELGMLSNRLLIRMFEIMERQMIGQADIITVHSPGNVHHVIRSGGRPDRTEVVFNWVDTKRVEPRPRENKFAEEQGLEDSFVVSYAGTMGWAQDMMTIVESAALLKSDSKILFLLVGSGVEKSKAQKRAGTLACQNIIWLPMQAWHVYPDILAASDASMINLHPSLRTPVVPSKLISIMAAGRPVIASLPIESDARNIIKDASCGICVEAGNAQALAEAIGLLSADPELAVKMGRSGRAYVESHFTQYICTRKMESVLLRAGATGQNDHPRAWKIRTAITS